MAEEAKKVANPPERDEASIKEFFNEVAKKFEARQKVLVDAYNKDLNLGNRFELKLRLDELVYLFDDIATLMK